MKKTLLIGLALVLSGAVAHAQSNEWDALRRIQGEAPNEPLVMDVILNGHCDGLTVNIDPEGMITGSHTSSCAACPGDAALGGLVLRLLANSKPSGHVYYAPALDTALHTDFHPDGTWRHFDWDGHVFNQGTWTLCSASPEVNPSDPPSDWPPPSDG